MNKLLIVLLAICLVSVHAFVKRDAPAPASEDAVAKAQKMFEDWSKTVNDELSKNFNPDKIKQAFNEMVDTVQRTIQPQPKSGA